MSSVDMRPPPTHHHQQQQQRQQLQHRQQPHHYQQQQQQHQAYAYTTHDMYTQGGNGSQGNGNQGNNMAAGHYASQPAQIKPRTSVVAGADSPTKSAFYQPMASGDVPVCILLVPYGAGAAGTQSPSAGVQPQYMPHPYTQTGDSRLPGVAGDASNGGRVATLSDIKLSYAPSSGSLSSASSSSSSSSCSVAASRRVVKEALDLSNNHDMITMTSNMAAMSSNARHCTLKQLLSMPSAVRPVLPQQQQQQRYPMQAMFPPATSSANSPNVSPHASPRSSYATSCSSSPASTPSSTAASPSPLVLVGDSSSSPALSSLQSTAEDSHSPSPLNESPIIVVDSPGSPAPVDGPVGGGEQQPPSDAPCTRDTAPAGGGPAESRPSAFRPIKNWNGRSATRKRHPPAGFYHLSARQQRLFGQKGKQQQNSTPASSMTSSSGSSTTIGNTTTTTTTSSSRSQCKTFEHYGAFRPVSKAGAKSKASPPLPTGATVTAAAAAAAAASGAPPKAANLPCATPPPVYSSCQSAAASKSPVRSDQPSGGSRGVRREKLLLQVLLERSCSS
ncbi:mucin-5AC-like [Sycon ciliatum]|uniref:mucin-5AC-like n=1 Tax=Sycon ciliatum TaxID=27933 RepID=UPI0031F5FA15